VGGGGQPGGGGCRGALRPGWGGLAQPVPAPPPAPAAPAAAAPAPVREPPFLTARVVMTVLRDDGTDIRTFAVRKHGNRVRVDPGKVSDTRFTAETLFDYDRRESYRNLAGDKITFSYRIGARDRVLAQVEGLMTTPADEPVYRLEINPDLDFDGHPCTLVLAGFPSPIGRIHALRWVWEARDLDGQPVKVVFPQGDGSILIVEYRDASGAPFDPALVSVPADRPVMSGF
jgi:hypothetical protein